MSRGQRSTLTFLYSCKPGTVLVKTVLPSVLLCFFFNAFAKADSTTVATFNFNDHTFNELNGKVITEPVGVSLVEDRFGNEESALYLHGHTNSYLNLGSSDILKPGKGTISVWAKLERIVFAGKGYEMNPIIITRNSNEVDFYDAYTLFYDFKSDRLMVFFSKDSTEQAGINSIESLVFNSWYHLAFTYDDKKCAFYINGKKQGEADKNFKAIFLKNSPVYVGHSASTKNDRRSRGSIDDIQIFHRVLSENEIEDLYNAPNPNKSRIITAAILKYAGIGVLIFITALLLVWQRRRALFRTQERLELKRKLHEMEIRTLKAQMNPHFIFNALNSIQQFIMSSENDKAEKYLSKFSKLLRRLLESNANESLSVQEEADILNRYIELEALRFNHSFSYFVEISEIIDPGKIMIPHLMVQPFVENAIWHGLLTKKGERQLIVRFDPPDEGTITCTIDDNGIGREASRKKEDTFRKRSLALSLIKQRLELMSNTMKVKCKLEIIDKADKSGKSAGTRVIIILPVLNKTDYVTSDSH